MTDLQNIFENAGAKLTDGKTDHIDLTLRSLDGSEYDNLFRAYLFLYCPAPRYCEHEPPQQRLDSLVRKLELQFSTMPKTRVECAIVLSALSRHRGDYQESLDWLNKVENLGVDSRRAEILIGQTWSKMYLGKYEEARDILEQTANILNNSLVEAEYSIVRGWHYWFSGELGEAEKSFKKAVNVKGCLSAKIDAELGLAHVYSIKGKKEDALTTLSNVHSQLSNVGNVCDRWYLGAWISLFLSLGWFLHQFNATKRGIARARQMLDLGDEELKEIQDKVKAGWEKESAWALASFAKASRTAGDYQHFLGQVDSLYGKGVVCNAANDLETAKECFAESIKLATKDRYPFYYWRSMISQVFCLIDQRKIRELKGKDLEDRAINSLISLRRGITELSRVARRELQRVDAREDRARKWLEDLEQKITKMGKVENSILYVEFLLLKGWVWWLLAYQERAGPQSKLWGEARHAFETALSRCDSYPLGRLLSLNGIISCLFEEQESGGYIDKIRDSLEVVKDFGVRWGPVIIPDKEFIEFVSYTFEAHPPPKEAKRKYPYFDALYSTDYRDRFIEEGIDPGSGKPRPRPIDKQNAILFLRRWNSYTPILTPGELIRKTHEDVGGGFYIRWKGKGIAVDPGIDFLRNLYTTKWGPLTVRDIDFVVVTHFHLDHMADLLPMFDLMYRSSKVQAKGRGGKERARVYLNPTTWARCRGWADEENTSPYEIGKMGKEIREEYNAGAFIITCHKVWHEEIGTTEARAHPLAIKIELKDPLGYSIKIAFTGDTRWPSESDQLEFVRFFVDADIIVANIGKLYPLDTTEGKVYGKHLSGKGILQLCEKLAEEWMKEEKCSEKIIVVSEFGLEFKEYRSMFVHLLESYVERLYEKQSKQPNVRFYPADLDLAILFQEQGGYSFAPRCPLCRDEYLRDGKVKKALSHAKEVRDFHDEGEKIVYVCRDPHVA